MLKAPKIVTINLNKCDSIDQFYLKLNLKLNFLGDFNDDFDTFFNRIATSQMVTHLIFYNFFVFSKQFKVEFNSLVHLRNKFTWQSDSGIIIFDKLTSKTSLLSIDEVLTPQLTESLTP